jgi:hypothetical protein
MVYALVLTKIFPSVALDMIENFLACFVQQNAKMQRCDEQCYLAEVMSQTVRKIKQEAHLSKCFNIFSTFSSLLRKLSTQLLPSASLLRELPV